MAKRNVKLQPHKEILETPKRWTYRDCRITESGWLIQFENESSLPMHLAAPTGKLKTLADSECVRFELHMLTEGLVNPGGEGSMLLKAFREDGSIWIGPAEFYLFSLDPGVRGPGNFTPVNCYNSVAINLRTEDDYAGHNLDYHRERLTAINEENASV